VWLALRAASAANIGSPADVSPLRRGRKFAAACRGVRLPRAFVARPLPACGHLPPLRGGREFGAACGRVRFNGAPADLDRKTAAFDFDDGRIVEMLREARRVDCRRCDDQLQIASTLEQALEKP